MAIALSSFCAYSVPEPAVAINYLNQCCKGHLNKSGAGHWMI